MTNGCEHNLHVLLHHQLPLQVLLSLDIGEDKDHLARGTVVMRLDFDVVVHAIDVATTLILAPLVFGLLPSLLLTGVIIVRLVVVAGRVEVLVHVEEDGVIGSHGNHILQERVSVDIGDADIDGAEVVY